MITLGAPLALAAGVGLAGAAVLLHLLAPRPPRRAPLPTARFLPPDPHDRPRWHRRPFDRAVLALRVAVALLLGLLFARPGWQPTPADGVTRLILVDGGAGMADRRAAVGDALAEQASGAEGPVRALVFGATGWRELAPDQWTAEPPTLGPGDDGQGAPGRGDDATDGSYLVAMRGLRALAATVETREVEAVVVTYPRWGAWDEQFTAVRRAAWPGRLRVVVVEAGDGASSASPASSARPADARPAGAQPTGAQPTGEVGRPSAQVMGDPAIEAALDALGYHAAAAAPNEPGVVVWTDEATQPLPPLLESAAARGDTVIVFAGAGAELPTAVVDLWAETAWPEGAVGSEIRAAAVRISTGEQANRRLVGRAVAADEGVRVLPIVAADGRPLAAARRWGEGCIVRYGAPAAVGSTDAAFPALLAALLDGCRQPLARRPSSTPLGQAARAAFEGEGPERLATDAVAEGAARRLEPWVLLALVLAAVAESWVVASRRRSAA